MRELLKQFAISFGAAFLAFLIIVAFLLTSLTPLMISSIDAGINYLEQRIGSIEITCSGSYNENALEINYQGQKVYCVIEEKT